MAALFCFCASITPTPRASNTGTVTGPVVTAPQSHATPSRGCKWVLPLRQQHGKQNVGVRTSGVASGTGTGPVATVPRHTPEGLQVGVAPAAAHVEPQLDAQANTGCKECSFEDSCGCCSTTASSITRCSADRTVNAHPAPAPPPVSIPCRGAPLAVTCLMGSCVDVLLFISHVVHLL
jgi:hypothetical protein